MTVSSLTTLDESVAKPAEAARTHSDYMKWFLHDRFGMFIHWGLYSIPSRGEWVRSSERMTVEAYQQYFDEFNPTRYDPREWAALARAAGQRYVVLTTKHHDGFCLFDSKLTEYSAPHTPARDDLVRPFVDACREEGLKVGFYYSLLDWHHPNYPVIDDLHHPLRDTPPADATSRDLSVYQRYLHGQVRELMTNYGEIDLLWFDFSYQKLSGEAWRADELVEMIRQLQPGIVINNRLVAGHAESGGRPLGERGDYATPEQTVPSAGIVDAQGASVPWEAAMTTNKSWGYQRDDKDYKSPRDIVRMLVECVSKGGNLLLNIGPDPLGRVPQPCDALLKRVGRWMDDNGESIYGCGSATLPKPEWGYYTQRDDGVLFAHIFDRPAGPIVLEGLADRIDKARLLSDRSEVSTVRPWMVGENRLDAFLTLPTTLPDELDTVVMLQLKD